MQLVKQQRFHIGDRNGCASIYEYKPTKRITFQKTLYAVSIYVEGKPSFVNRIVETRAKAEKIYNQELEKLNVVF